MYYKSECFQGLCISVIGIIKKLPHNLKTTAEFSQNKTAQKTAQNPLFLFFKLFIIIIAHAN